jgi:hypothetical protein
MQHRRCVRRGERSELLFPLPERPVQGCISVRAPQERARPGLLLPKNFDRFAGIQKALRLRLRILF